MSSRCEQMLQRSAWELFRRLGFDEERISVTISNYNGRRRLTIEVEPKMCEDRESSPEDRRPVDVPVTWLWLSPAEEAVVRRLRVSEDWVTAEQLAKAADRECQAEFRAMLRNLVERGILLSSQGRGYRLNIPADEAGHPARHNGIAG